MAEETVIELVPPVVPVVSPVLEQVIDPNASPNEPVIEEIDDTVEPPHPLAPGGRRFEQVYARGKQAERERDTEREARIRAETELELLKRGTPAQPKVYEWDELEAMIAAGQITRAQAMAHRESVVRKDVVTEVKRDFQHETSEGTRINALSSAIYSYVQAVPAIDVVGSPIRTRVDAEFDWLVSVNGKNPETLSKPERKALELTALRNVLGPVESLNKRMVTNAEPHQGLPGGTPPKGKVNPDQELLNKLKPNQIEHYTRMMKIGKYPGGWKDVVVELKFVPPTRKV